MKTALITGVTGQDGSYLAELLLEKGYAVSGTLRPSTKPDQLWRIRHIADRIDLLKTDYGDIEEIVAALRPEEIYHLAAQSRVDESFRSELSTFQFNITTTDQILASIRKHSPRTKFYFAATSEMFGATKELPQHEATPFDPVSPYGVSKVAGFHLVRVYRRAYGLFAASGMLFNHESPRRGEDFVTRKIARAVASIKKGEAKELRLGNLAVRRDWGYAKEYVEAMWRMLQKDSPGDYVIGTGENHSLEEFLDIAFKAAGLDWQDYVVSDPDLFRPLEAPETLANPGKAKKELGWEAEMKFPDLVRMMVEAELEEVYNRKTL